MKYLVGKVDYNTGYNCTLGVFSEEQVRAHVKGFRFERRFNNTSMYVNEHKNIALSVRMIEEV